MKKIFGLVIAVFMLMLVLCACGNQTAVNNNLVIKNSSAETLNGVAIQLGNETQAMGSPLAPDEEAGFEMGAVTNCKFRVDITDKNDQVFNCGEFTKDFSEDKDKIVYLDIVKDDKGNWSAVSK